MAGFGSSDPDRLIEFGLRLGVAPTSDPKRIKSLRGKIQRTLKSGGGQQAKLTQLIEELADYGMHFDSRFIFAAFKGRMVLHGEGYVPPSRFEPLLRQRATNVLRRKLPLTLADEAKRNCGRLLRGIRELLPEERADVATE
jgi:hypothetical protein